MKFVVLIALCLSYSAPAVAEDSLGELSGLVARGKSEGKTCGKFTRKWKGMVKGGVNRDSPSHFSRQQSIEALALLEKYPGRAPSMAKAWDFLIENEVALQKLPDQKALLVQFGKIESACEQFSHWTHLTLLMKDISVFELPKKEAKRVYKVIHAHLADDRTNGGLVPLAMKLHVLNDFLHLIYEGDNREALKVKSEALIADFEVSREQLGPQLKAQSVAGKGDVLEYWAPEFQLWRRLHGLYQGLLAEVQF